MKNFKGSGGVVTIAESAVNSHNTHTHVDHTHSLTHDMCNINTQPRYEQLWT